MPDNEKLTHKIYRRLLGEHPGEGAAAFIRNLGWIGVSFSLARVISGLANIAAARMLGPGEYGKISVLVSTGAIITPFLLIGLNYSVMKYGTLPEERDRMFTTAGAAFLVLILLTSAFLIFFRTALSALLGIDARVLLLALVYAIAASAFTLASSMQQALGSFSRRGLSEIFFSLLLAAVFFLGVRYYGRVYETMIWAYTAAFGCVSVFSLAIISRGVKFSLLSVKRFLTVSEYGIYYFGSGLSAFLLLSVQSLVLNALLTPREVGVYAAYITASVGMAAYLGTALTAVLFPKAVASTNRRRLWDLGARSWRYLGPAALLFFMLSETAVLSLMGRHQYALDIKLVFLFACCGTLLLAYYSQAQIIFSEGTRASRLSLIMALAGGAFNFAACLLLVPLFKIAGAAIAFIITYSVLLAWLWKAKDSHLGNQEAA